MRHPLDGCFLKLARADQHFDALRAAIAEAIPSEPDIIPGELDPASGAVLFRAQRDSSTPPEWSALLGDLVHNLYASLDHLACALVAANGGKVTRRTAFPIYQDRAEYGHPRRGAGRKIAGMAPAAAALIARLQPFQHPARWHPSEHPLGLLYDLEMTDKHRTLVLTDNATDATIEGLPQHVLLPIGPIPLTRGAHQKGDVLAHFDGLAAASGAQVRLRVVYRVALDLEWPVDPTEAITETLDRIRQHVRGVVLQFRPFF
jgi:hypothetical protein